MEKDRKEKKKKMVGGSEQKRPSRPLPRAVATARVAPPPRARSSVHPEPARARIRSPRVSSHCARAFPSLPRSASPAK